MFRGRFLFSVLISLVVIALLVAGAYALVQNSWAQGYLAGSAAAGEGSPPTAPFIPYRPAYFGLGFFPLLCGLGFLFLFGLFALRFLFFGRAIRSWKRSGWPGARDWHGHPGHWGRWGEKPDSEGASEPEQDLGRGEPGPVI